MLPRIDGVADALRGDVDRIFDGCKRRQHRFDACGARRRKLGQIKPDGLGEIERIALERAGIGHHRRALDRRCLQTAPVFPRCRSILPASPPARPLHARPAPSSPRDCRPWRRYGCARRLARARCGRDASARSAFCAPARAPPASRNRPGLRTCSMNRTMTCVASSSMRNAKKSSVVSCASLPVETTQESAELLGEESEPQRRAHGAALGDDADGAAFSGLRGRRQGTRARRSARRGRSD